MGEQGHLLVVDDEELNRDMLSRRLRRVGYTVDCAEDGEHALDLIGRAHYDLVLLDVMMPGLSGVEVLQEIRSHHTPAALPVIMATAQTGSEDMVKALDSGANDYLTKPIDFPVACARIRSAIERKRSEDRLRDSEERYALAMKANGDALFDWNLSTGRVYYSEPWQQVLGLKNETRTDIAAWFERVHPKDIEAVRCTFDEQIEHPGVQVDIEFRVRHADGDYRWVKCRASATVDREGRCSRLVGSIEDITTERLVDRLTGLSNQDHFLDLLETAFAETRDESEQMAVVLLGIDRFAMLQAELGALSSDKLVKRIAKKLTRAVRRHDRVAHLKGDQFAVLLGDLEEKDHALAAAQRLQKRLALSVDVRGSEVFLSPHLGVVMGPGDYPSHAELFADAETALQRAKANKQGVVYFDRGDHKANLEMLQLESDLRRAVERHEFVPYFQPIMRLEDDSFVGFEALVRWQHSSRGLVSPNLFLPIAERNDLIAPIGLQVMRASVRQLKAWQDEGLVADHVFMTVNVSGRQLETESFVDDVRSVLESTGVNPACIKLEVTETIAMDETQGALELLSRLRALGVGIAIDDFGTGHSSLSYLHKLPATTLKIDRSFVKQLSEGADNTDVIRTIVLLGHGMKLDIVVEGIETPEDEARMRELGCDYGQGYYYSRPLERTAARDWMRSRGGEAPSS